MRVLLNLIWLIFGGLFTALGYAVAGIVMFILIITIPFGIQAFKLAGFCLWPFGRTVVRRDESASGLALVGNVIWLLLAGWWIALGHLVSAFLTAITIIGIPLAVANIKLIPVALWPFGREVVPVEVAEARGQQAIVAIEQRD